MKRMLLLFSLLVVFQMSSVFAQTLSDYVLEVRGDTLVVKDELDMGAPDALNLILAADTVDVPAGRVYMLHDYGYYSIVNAPTSSTTRRVIIMGENNQLLKTRTDDAVPPIVCGAVAEGVNSTGGLNSGYDLVVRNVNISAGNSSGNMGWTTLGSSGGARIELDNCIFEHTRWVQINPGAGSRMFFKNCYFVNLSGYACRRNGGVIDFFSSQDTISVENSTHVMTQGLLYKARQGYSVNRSIYNHNTFVNNSGVVFMNMGSIGNVSLTNNIFVNSNLQPYSTSLQNADGGEVDADKLPMGLVNVRNDSAFVANGGRFYVDKNLVYWDPTFNDVVTTLNTASVNGKADWTSQMITMNSRSQDMFDDDANYPYLTEGTWITGVKPNFADTQDLFTTQLAALKTFITAAVDTNSTAILEDWRLINDPAEYYTYADWPIPIDFSYDNAELLTAGLNGFPVGDLNWFPAQYTQWLAQRDDELQYIHNVLQTGNVGVKEVAGIPENYQLEQNFPNPFNPSTVINYTIPKAGNVTLKIFNIVGQEVATLVNGFQEAAKYQVSFNASNLSSGIYFYTINAGNFNQTKKMMLIK